VTIPDSPRCWAYW